MAGWGEEDETRKSYRLGGNENVPVRADASERVGSCAEAIKFAKNEKLDANKLGGDLLYIDAINN